MKLLLNCSFQPQNTGLMGFLRCIPVYYQHSNVSQITILYGMIMQKEEILGFLVVIIAIPDCLYLSYTYHTLAKVYINDHFKKIPKHTGNQENLWQ